MNVTRTENADHYAHCLLTMTEHAARTLKTINALESEEAKMSARAGAALFARLCPNIFPAAANTTPVTEQPSQTDVNNLCLYLKFFYPEAIDPKVVSKKARTQPGFLAVMKKIASSVENFWATRRPACEFQNFFVSTIVDMPVLCCEENIRRTKGNCPVMQATLRRCQVFRELSLVRLKDDASPHSSDTVETDTAAPQSTLSRFLKSVKSAQAAELFVDAVMQGQVKNFERWVKSAVAQLQEEEDRRSREDQKQLLLDFPDTQPRKHPTQKASIPPPPQDRRTKISTEEPVEKPTQQAPRVTRCVVPNFDELPGVHKVQGKQSSPKKGPSILKRIVKEQEKTSMMLSLAARVSRWREVTALEQIKCFTDKGPDGVVKKRYEKMNGAQLEGMLVRHHVPGIEKLLQSQSFVSTYCRRTPEGYLIKAQLTRGMEQEWTVISVGMKESSITHLFIHPNPEIRQLVENRHDLDFLYQEGDVEIIESASASAASESPPLIQELPSTAAGHPPHLQIDCSHPLSQYRVTLAPLSNNGSSPKKTV